MMKLSKKEKMEETGSISERQNIVLMVLYSFYVNGREEISLPEFLECVKNIQEKIPLKYEFSKRFLYSLELLEDLRSLEYQGFARRFAYKHDSFLPKRYIALTELGKSHIKRITQKLPQDLNLLLKKCVETTIQSYQEKLRLFARPGRIAE